MSTDCHVGVPLQPAPAQLVAALVEMKLLPVIGMPAAVTDSALVAKVATRLGVTVCKSKFALSVAVVSVPSAPAASVGVVLPARVKVVVPPSDCTKFVGLGCMPTIQCALRGPSVTTGTPPTSIVPPCQRPK